LERSENTLLVLHIYNNKIGWLGKFRDFG
jgi:hypothetical protein